MRHPIPARQLRAVPMPTTEEKRSARVERRVQAVAAAIERTTRRRTRDAVAMLMMVIMRVMLQMNLLILVPTLKYSKQLSLLRSLCLHGLRVAGLQDAPPSQTLLVPHAKDDEQDAGLEGLPVPTQVSSPGGGEYDGGVLKTRTTMMRPQIMMRERSATSKAGTPQTSRCEWASPSCGVDVTAVGLNANDAVVGVRTGLPDIDPHGTRERCDTKDHQHH
jgi:hypothetical protein